MSNWLLSRRYILRIVVDLRNWLLPYILCYLLSCNVLESWLVHKGDFRDAVSPLWMVIASPSIGVYLWCLIHCRSHHHLSSWWFSNSAIMRSGILLPIQLMSEVCPNVATEPTLQPVTTERFFSWLHKH